MKTYRASLVLDARATLAECPLWSATESCLYWVDIAGRAIHCFDPATGIDRAWPVPSEPGCIAHATDGRLVVAMRTGFAYFDPANGMLTPIADTPFDTREMRFNDGRCDAVGRFWAGAMFEPRTAERAPMVCLERGAARIAWGAADGLGVKVSNGLAFSRDGKWLFQSDTPNHVVYRFPFDPASGQVGAREVFVRVSANRSEPGYGGRPDGAAVDSEDAYWSAQYEGGRVLRFSPSGEVVAVVEVPVTRPTMIAFGGPRLSTLFITTAREGASDEELAREPQAGGIFACEVEVAGVVEPFYASM